MRQTVSQLGPANTVSGCAPVMSEHEKKKGEGRIQTFLNLSAITHGRGVMTEDWNVERGLWYREWFPNMTK